LACLACCVFFLQAEDGIRDRNVTGVQTCALPIFMVILISAVLIGLLYWFFGTELGCAIRATGSNPNMSRAQGINTNFNVVLGLKIGRASCRERVRKSDVE